MSDKPATPLIDVMQDQIFRTNEALGLDKHALHSERIALISEMQIDLRLPQKEHDLLWNKVGALSKENDELKARIDVLVRQLDSATRQFG
jgi:hypothetical protein